MSAAIFLNPMQATRLLPQQLHHKEKAHLLTVQLGIAVSILCLWAIQRIEAERTRRRLDEVQVVVGIIERGLQALLCFPARIARKRVAVGT